jgi:GT2 family glycosyltransferase
MPDYKQGKIYTIRCKTDDTLIYVGSTIEPLCRRMSKHKYDSLNKPTIFFYQHIDDWDNWYIELFENFPCNSKEELNKRGGEIFREIGMYNSEFGYYYADGDMSRRAFLFGYKYKSLKDIRVCSITQDKRALQDWHNYGIYEKCHREYKEKIINENIEFLK